MSKMSLGPIYSIPSELLSFVLDNLSLPDVLRMSHVSTRCRAVARSHPTFWRDIFLHSVSGPDMDFFIARLESTAASGLCIYIDILHVDSSRPETAAVLSAVGRQLPRTTSLHLCLHRGLAPYRLAPLCQPAPLLEKLDLDFRNRHGPASLPGNLFGGLCPNLRSLGLVECQLPRHPITAFANVRRLRFGLLDPQVIPTDFFTQFPSLSDLEIDSRDGLGDLDRFSAQFQQSWPGLASLNLEIPGPDSVMLFTRCPRLLSTPKIEFQCANIDEVLLLLADRLPGLLAIELLPSSGKFAWYTIRSHSHGWTRRFMAFREAYLTAGRVRQMWWPSHNFYSSDTISRRVTTLAVSSSLLYLADLIGELPACNTLRITLDGALMPSTRSAGRPGHQPLALPGLKRLELHSSASGPPSIESTTVAHFFARIVRSISDPVTLELDGISLSGDVAILPEHGLVVEEPRTNALIASVL